MPSLPTVILLSLLIWTATAGALTLTDQERAWLADHQELRLGVDTSWPPFEYRDENGHYQGLAADYVRLIQDRLGVKVKLIEPPRWGMVLELARDNQLDLVPGVMSTPERQKYLAFTRPYIDFPMVILAHEGGARPRNLKDLYGLKIAVVDSYAPHELLRTHHPDLNLVAMPNVSSTLQALATGKVDAVVSDLASSVWSLRELKLEGLYVSGETPYRYQLAMGVPSEDKLLVGILDKVLADLSLDETNAIQHHWVGNFSDNRTFWSDLLLYGVPALLLLSTVLVIVIRINRRLSSEISRRVALEQELRSSEYHYRGLVESLSAIAWEASITDFTYSYVSPHAEELLGYPRAHWLIPGFWRNIIHPADLTRAEAYCWRETRANRDHSVDYRVITADGRCLWVRDIVSLIEHGHEPVLRGLMIDISEAKRTEEALQRSEQKFASVFQQCPDILVIARLSDGCLLEVNKAFEDQIGLSAADVLGKTATDLNIWGVDQAGPDLLHRVQTTSIRNLEMAFRRSNGQAFTGLVSAEPFQLDTVEAIVVVVRDISQLKETQQQLQTSEEKFAKAFHASPDGLLLSRQRDGLLIEVNEGFSRITGFTAATSIDQTALELGIWVDLNERKHLLELMRRDGFVRDFICHIRRADGLIRLCELSSRPLPIGDEDCMLTIARDITERQLMQEKLQQAATVFESTAEGVLITDTRQNISAVNRAFSEITGYSEAEALGETPRLLASGLHDSAFYAAMWHQLTAYGHWQGEISNRRKNGELYPSWLTISAVRNGDQVTHFVAVFADISSLKLAQARLDYQAHHDPLTGLPNRTLFENRLQAALNGQQETGKQGAVLFLDLDRFKHINDSLGHPVGDLLLKDIALRLKEQLRDIDTVARLGGDEFIILLPGLQHPSDAEHLANKLLACFTPPFQAGEHEFFISASIGTSLYPQDGTDVATLVKNADAAMYRSKAKGRNRVESYTRDLTAQAKERVALEQELRRAIERNECSLYYQPKLCLKTHALIGAEALIRWHHPTFGDVPPEHFIPLAEENGMILQIGDWVLEQACRQLHAWQGTFDDFGPLSVNLAGAQLRHPKLLPRIEQLLRDYRLEPGCLQLEITENFIMSQAEEALDVLHELKRLGVQLAIDDFGTGYSSLSYLKRLPLDFLKIDQSFVRGLPDDTHDAAIVRAIIALGHSMQFTIIAEGVENPAQQAFLADEGCEQMQGYIVSLPLPPALFAATFLRMKVEDFSDSTARKPSL
ncbi:MULTISPECIES: bifunctional diguanylate cyclase/phosphodiesterase [Pseudomonas]|uniref:EAL domain-containing protein n=1 Tax=Pseudomonas quebecensis TaxID=2995174 RepID=A0ABY6QGU7_9PSED|nr:MULTISPECIES: EAL domain-containing protein [Pseudomonas]MCP1513176.1 diguanylate cyclase (GGDEF)-like protein/PAS domain S-box-containing protein [Pseudomonas rhodesiae]MCX4065128.1 EAL domain-containing protein [Pseudomonas quebecensis]MDF9772038.1 diguanylate cyclase (GGDEF)-like protein/PAS domain S-box-containing protein [Pseudomonas rhodesiae]UZW19039.1 EAL domain-containing protein [Pseudomonas quebecensis]UZW23546.1 EAL domain-containing protein [Pseudomonas quebecensis]